jgi:hypothetical protein
MSCPCSFYNAMAAIKMTTCICRPVYYDYYYDDYYEDDYYEDDYEDEDEVGLQTFKKHIFVIQKNS